jgi:ferric-dicitrate binding protein FerR (iron transport regulator)
MSTEKFKGWDSIDGSSVSSEEIEETFRTMMAKAKSLESQYNRQYHRHNSFLRPMLYAAAAVAFLLMTTLTVKYALERNQQPTELSYTQTTTAKGEIREVVLPDQTKVVLNAGSILIYPESFGKDRSVFLSGEAIFDVTPSKEHSFIVKTSDVSVRVYGTKFNVRSYLDDKDISVTLCRGAIAAFPNGREDKAVHIIPNQNYTYDKVSKSYTTSNVNALESTSWEGGDICFRSESIHDIIKTIERKYNVNVYLSTGKYDKALITARFVNGESLDELMDVICQIVPGMKYRIDDSNVYLK